MVDWNGLYNWSMKYQDGTQETSSDFKAMSKEDREFLESAMKEFTYNEADRLQQITEKLKVPQELEAKELQSLLDELEELFDIHQDNAKNFCKMGGYLFLLELIMSHPEPKVRKQSCTIFTLGTQYNPFVQEFGLSHGALKLMNKLYEEESATNRASLMGCVSALVKGPNFEGKRKFLQEFKGLEFLAEILLQNSETEVVEVDAKWAYALVKKSLILIFDIIGSDNQVFPEKQNCCKAFLLENAALLQRLYSFLDPQKVQDRLLLDVREFTLNIFRILASFEKTLLSQGLQEVLSNLSRALIGAKVDQDLRSLFQKEQELIIQVLQASKGAVIENYDQEKKQEKPVLSMRN